jgi:hypothetical protein
MEVRVGENFDKEKNIGQRSKKIHSGRMLVNVR